MKKLDFHTHITDETVTVEESAAYFQDLCIRHGLEGIVIHAATVNSAGLHPDCNEKALEISRLLGGAPAFASLHHERDFVEQTKEYMTQGFRGIKLLEGKPSLYRHYGYGFEHPRFEPFFAYAEEQSIPLLIHNNDPAANWDVANATEDLIQKGWIYDSTMPTQEDFFRTLEDVLARHPNLRAAIAHFGFYSNDLPRATRLMERYPNLRMDLTPALIIFHELSKTPAETKEFLLRYQDRLIFGTDVSNRIEDKVRTLNDKKHAVMTAFFEGEGDYDFGKYSVCGMGLEESVLSKIYYENAMKFMA